MQSIPLSNNYCTCNLIKTNPLVSQILLFENVDDEDGGRCHPISFPGAFGAGELKIVVVVALLFYVHGKHLRSCRDGQVT